MQKYQNRKLFKRDLAKWHWQLATLIEPLPVANCQTKKERQYNEGIIYTIHRWKEPVACCHLGAKYASNWNCSDFSWND